MGRPKEHSVTVESESDSTKRTGDGADVVPIHRKRELAIAAALIGSSGPIVKLRRAVGRAADVDVPVLVTGEVGSGRSLVAQLIHEGAARAGEFLQIRCGALSALPAALVQGAPRRPGIHSTAGDRDRSPSAEATTVFLDGIDELAPELQARLVRILDARSATAPATAPRARIVASTAADLDEVVATGTLRSDLLHRLDVLRIRVPSLAERGRDDFEELVRAFSARQPRSVTFTDRAVEWLFNRSWPANVRELQNMIQRVTIMTEIETIDLREVEEHVGPAGVAGGPPALNLLIDRVFAASAPALGRHSSVELAMIARALEISANETAAARLLGIDRRIMLRRRARLEKDPQPRKKAKGK